MKHRKPVLTVVCMLILSGCTTSAPDVDVQPELLQGDCAPRDGMIGLRRSGQEQCYWIDARRTTGGDYYAALMAGMTATSHPACGASYQLGPRLEVEELGSEHFCGPQTNPENWYPSWPPVGVWEGWGPPCISWCDAVSYCEFQGKRLCRIYNSAGEPVDTLAVPPAPDELVLLANSSATSEWFRACAGFRELSSLPSFGRDCATDQDHCPGPFEGMTGMVGEVSVAGHYRVRSRIYEEREGLGGCDTYAKPSETPTSLDRGAIRCCAD